MQENGKDLFTYDTNENDINELRKSMLKLIKKNNPKSLLLKYYLLWKLKLPDYRAEKEKQKLRGKILFDKLKGNDLLLKRLYFNKLKSMIPEDTEEKEEEYIADKTLQLPLKSKKNIPKITDCFKHIKNHNMQENGKDLFTYDTKENNNRTTRVYTSSTEKVFEKKRNQIPISLKKNDNKININIFIYIHNYYSPLLLL